MALALLVSKPRTRPQSPPLPGTPTPTGNLSSDDVASNRNIAELLGHVVPVTSRATMCMPRVVSETGQSMTEQVPENLTEEVVDQPEVGGSENEGDGASEVDRWEDEGGHDRAG